MSRIVQVANFVAPHSGGIRTVLGHLAVGYAAAGHEVFQIVPGDRNTVAPAPWGLRFTVAAVPIPRTGYRIIRPSVAASVVADLSPDRIEVHDRTTLRGLGRWATTRDVGSVVVSHERLDRVLAQWLPERAASSSRSQRWVDSLADRGNRRLAADFDTVVCTTDWAAAEFDRLLVNNVRRIPLGVDLTMFRPREQHPVRRRGRSHLVMASRLSREKHPELAVDCVAELLRRGHRARLTIAGDGPQRRRLEARAKGLPVEFLGHLAGGEAVARLVSGADVVLAPGPVETFGLAALEALACGTPVVANAASALREIVGGAGAVALGTPTDFADAVESILVRPEALRRRAARERAEKYGWNATVDGFLAAHRLPSSVLSGHDA